MDANRLTALKSELCADKMPIGILVNGTLGDLKEEGLLIRQDVKDRTFRGYAEIVFE